MIKIDGVAKRNLQEQVGYNSEQIDKIFELLDGLNVQDNLIKLTASSGTLTAEEMDVVSKDVAFIIYNNNLYIKTTTSATEYTFKQVALSASDQGTYNILQSFRIVITRANGAYLYSSNTVLSLYNKAEMDSLLGAKANLSGADFTGNVTAPQFYGDNAKPLYWHSITLQRIYSGTLRYYFDFIIINNDPTPFTLTSFMQWLKDHQTAEIKAVQGYYSSYPSDLVSYFKYSSLSAIDIYSINLTDGTVDNSTLSTSADDGASLTDNGVNKIN